MSYSLNRALVPSCSDLTRKTTRSTVTMRLDRQADGGPSGLGGIRACSDPEATAPFTASKSQGNPIHPDGRWPIWTISCRVARPGCLAQRDLHLSETPFGDHPPAVRRSQSIRRRSRPLASLSSSGIPALQRLRAIQKTAEGIPSVLPSSDWRARVEVRRMSGSGRSSSLRREA